MSKNKKPGMRLFRREWILKKITELGEVSLDNLTGTMEGLFSLGSYMIKPYHSSYQAFKNAPITDVADFKIHSKKTLSVIISRLKYDGLINKTKRGTFHITPKGEKYLIKKSQNLSRQKIYSVNKKSNDTILVIFDVPEKQRAKRDWLRFHLVRFGFRMLQHSVWYGKTEIPEDFIKDLDYHSMLSYVHIFSINKKTTLPR